MSINVLVNGAAGKMGSETVKAIEAEADLTLVATNGEHDDLANAIISSNADVVVDFTQPSVVFNNTKTILENNARPVVGTTGLQPEQIEELTQLSKSKKLGTIIAPNFSIGAILMMKFAQSAAKHFEHVEIIERHHEAKHDSPSGTAIKTAELIHASRKGTYVERNQETLPGARGARFENIALHSLRLPGSVAHQEVIFGTKGETLTLKHDSIHRECFMPGVCLAIRKVMELHTLVYGLDNFL